MRRTINKAGLDLVRNSEGLSLKAYPDPGTGGDPWTIGFGHTGPEVKPGMVISRQRADELLALDMVRFEDCVASAAANPSSNQFSAMVSLCYNIGQGNFLKSSVLRRHNNGEHTLAGQAFSLWNKANGRVLPGLVKRRAAEAALYATPDRP